LEASYVGDQSNDLLNTGGAGSNINLVPLGAMLNASNPATVNPNLYRPLNNPATGAGYGDVNVATNNLYANYNALQVTWGRHAGRYTIQTNYSWQKAMGIISPGNPASAGEVTLNPFSVNANYGIQPGDRRQLLNLVYSIDLGSPFHGERIVGGAVNGWQLSGITQVQSGANLTFNSPNDNFNMQLNNAIIPGSISVANPNGIQINNQSILGTNAV